MRIGLFIEKNILLRTFQVVYMFVVVYIIFDEKLVLSLKIIMMLILPNLFFTLKLLDINFYGGLMLCCVLIFMLLIYICIYMIKNKKRKINYKRFSVKIISIAVIVLSTSLPAVFVSKNIKEYATILPSNKVRVSKNGSMIEGEMDILQNLEIEKWNTMNRQEKLNCTQTIINIESNKLSIHDAPSVVCSMLDGNINGQYLYKQNIIQINRQVLETTDTYKIVKIILHEIRHMYQHMIIDEYKMTTEKKEEFHLEKYAKKLEKALEKYDVDTIEYDNYYYSFLEVDARNYANATIGYYCNELYFLGKYVY